MTSVYLAHKFEKQEQALEVQQELEARGIKVVNPFQRKEQDQYNDTIKNHGGQFDDETCREIVDNDLAMIDNVDGIVAILSPNAIGTVNEIFYKGKIKGQPVFTWVAYQLPYRHPWIAHCSRFSSTDREEVLAKVFAWAEGR